MKALSFATLAFIFGVTIVTTVLHLTNLHRIMPMLKERNTSKKKGLPEHTRESLWNNTAQVALYFTNDGFHITSDKEWAALRTKIFKLDAQSDRTYMVSMQQQLHCLDIVRIAYLSYHLPRPRLKAAFYEEADACVEQIRQHMMCNADITLEPTKLMMSPDGSVVPGSGGTGVTHRCGDWQGLESAVNSWHV